MERPPCEQEIHRAVVHSLDHIIAILEGDYSRNTLMTGTDAAEKVRQYRDGYAGKAAELDVPDVPDATDSGEGS